MALQSAQLPRFAGESVPVGRGHVVQELRRHYEPRHVGFGGSCAQRGRLLGCGGLVFWARQQQGRTRLRQQMPHVQRCPKDLEGFRLPKPQRFQLSEVKTLHPEQKRAVDEIISFFEAENQVTLHGVTGSGKTLVASNVIARLQPKAVLVILPVKALAMQLQQAFETDFVDAASHMFVSHTCGYSPSSVVAVDNTLKVKKGRRVIEEDISRLRSVAIQSVVRGDPCIISSSVCAIYGCSPLLLNGQGESELTSEEIEEVVGQLKAEVKELEARSKGPRKEAVLRLLKRIEADTDKIQTRGTCPDMYELYNDLVPERFKRTLIDKMNEHFGKDWLLIVDECHSTVPALKGPHPAYLTQVGKEAARYLKREELISSVRRRGPLSWTQLQERFPSKVLWMSATPPPQDCPTVSLEIRPTHICDPVITRLSTKKNSLAGRGRSQHDLWSLLTEIKQILTGRRPEEQAIVASIECNQADVLHAFLSVDHRCGVVHGEQTKAKKAEVLKQFRDGELDVLCGSKMIIEGLDLPGVAMVIVADANCPGFLRAGAVLTQLVGRAARHASGRAYFLVTEGENKTVSVDECMQQHAERRERQEKYNAEHGTTAESIEWAPRLTRAKKVDDTSPVLGSHDAANSKEMVYSWQQCVNILAALVQTCWAETPNETEDWTQDASRNGWTTPTQVAEWEEFYFPCEESELVLNQVVLMVTVPDIGPVRSYNLLMEHREIDTILSQNRTRLRDIEQIRYILSDRLLSPRTAHLLRSNRKKLTMILQLEEFTRQVWQLSHEEEKKLHTLRKEVKQVVQGKVPDKTDGFVAELVYRLVVLCGTGHCQGTCGK